MLMMRKYLGDREYIRISVPVENAESIDLMTDLILSLVYLEEGLKVVGRQVVVSAPRLESRSMSYFTLLSQEPKRVELQFTALGFMADSSEAIRSNKFIVEVLDNDHISITVLASSKSMLDHIRYESDTHQSPRNREIWHLLPPGSEPKYSGVLLFITKGGKIFSLITGAWLVVDDGFFQRNISELPEDLVNEYNLYQSARSLDTDTIPLPNIPTPSIMF